MHLVCLGIMQKLVLLWLHGPLKTKPGRRSVEQIMNFLVPSEFVALNEHSHSVIRICPAVGPYVTLVRRNVDVFGCISCCEVKWLVSELTLSLCLH